MIVENKSFWFWYFIIVNTQPLGYFSDGALHGRAAVFKRGQKRIKKILWAKIHSESGRLPQLLIFTFMRKSGWKCFETSTIRQGNSTPCGENFNSSTTVTWCEFGRQFIT
jgi:hypothetical protein